MKAGLHRIFGMLINRPLYAHPRTAVTIYNALCGRFGINALPANLPDLGDSDLIDARLADRVKGSRFTGDIVKTEDGRFPRVEPYKRTSDGIAVITIDGELVNRGAWVGADSGLVSYEGIGFQLQRAAMDQKAKIVLLDINTPGGEAVGVNEIAAKVRAVNEVKPVYAVSNGINASAGYALSSGARRIFAGPSSLTGSIGVVLLHLDASRALDKEGITPTLIHAGAHKVDGNQFEPLSDAVKEELQKEVQSFYDLFLQTVAAGRGRRLSRDAARRTEARTYLGAEAVSAGLADSVATFEEVLAEGTNKLRRAARSGGVKNMAGRELLGIGDDAEVREGDIIIPAGSSLANLLATARQEGRQEAQGDRQSQRPENTNMPKAPSPEEAVKAYNDKLKAVLAHEQAKGRESQALEIVTDHPEMSAEAVIKILSMMPGPAKTSEQSATLAERAEATGANKISAGPIAGSTTAILPGSGVGASGDHGWGPRMDRVNKSVQRSRRQMRAG